MSVTKDQAVAAAHAAVWQAEHPTSNVRHLRATSTKPYTEGGDETRSASLTVWEWSLALAVLDKHETQAVRELGENLRRRLQHPCAVDSDPTPPHGITRPSA